MEDLRVSNPNNEMSHSLEPMSPIEERNRLRQQLSEAMRELERFHKEMDGLSVQLNDMAVEMTESQTKVGVYSKRLAEVEHTLATTQEMNVNLQILLEKALNSQKQSNASTNHVVRNIQSDISKVKLRIIRMYEFIPFNQHQYARYSMKIAVCVKRLMNLRNTKRIARTNWCSLLIKLKSTLVYFSKLKMRFIK